MKLLAAVAAIALLAAPASALAQANNKEKSPGQIESEKAAKQAYERSLGNIPDQGPTDPWGGVRSEGAPKPVAKAKPAKRTKTGSAAK